MKQPQTRKPRGPSIVRRTDLARVLRTANESKVPIDRVEVARDGTISVVLKDGNFASYFFTAHYYSLHPLEAHMNQERWG